MSAATSLDDTISPAAAARLFLERLSRPSRLLVAISGGSDSLGLLLILHQELSRAGFSGISLVAATVDHDLRCESAAEARDVAVLCQKIGIDHRICRWDGPKPASGIPAAAREARYRLLAEAATGMGADIIVTGHTLDDQLETVAMRISRSDSHDNQGLSGMANAVLYDRRLWIARPFLDVARIDIRAVLRTMGYAWFDDPSNSDPKYERVRVRNSLSADAVVSTPQVEQAVVRRSALSSRAGVLLERYATVLDPSLSRIDHAGLANDPDGLRYALAVLCAVMAGREHRLSGTRLDRLMGFIEGNSSGRMTAGGAIFDRRRDGLYISREARGIETLRLEPGEEGIWDGRFHVLNGYSSSILVQGSSDKRPPDEAVHDFNDVPARLAQTLRKVQPCLRPAVAGEQFAAFSPGQVTFSRVLAPFDRFLPRFDVAVANRLAHMFGVTPYPMPPF